MSKHSKFTEFLKQNLDSKITKLIQILNLKFEVYVVGGFIRDCYIKFLGFERKLSKDIDICINAEIFEYIDLLQEFFKTFNLKCKINETYNVLNIVGLCEIATFREEEEYIEYRIPSKIKFIKNVEIDSKRRDFTCNAIYYDPFKNIIFDPFNGINDIKNNILNAIFSADFKFQEDALRILRALRFYSTLNLSHEIVKSIHKNHNLVMNLKAFAIKGELKKILLSFNEEKKINPLLSICLNIDILNLNRFLNFKNPDFEIIYPFLNDEFALFLLNKKEKKEFSIIKKCFFKFFYNGYFNIIELYLYIKSNSNYKKNEIFLIIKKMILAFILNSYNKFHYLKLLNKFNFFN